MAIKQMIGYNSNSRYFAGFLQSLIRESGVKANIAQESKEITLVLDDSDEKSLARFSSLSSKYLPHSIFLGDINTVGEHIDIQREEFISPTYNISLCVRCLEKLTNPSSEHYLDDTLTCHHYSKDEQRSFSDNTSFSAHYSEGDTLLVVNPRTIDELFIMTEDEKKALFSIEKPTIKVTIKDNGLKELTNRSFINIKSIYNTRSTLVSLNAIDGEVPYLFFDDYNRFKVAVVQKNITIIKDERGLEQELELFDKNPLINRFLNISNEAGFGSNSIGVNLSEKKGISFMVSNEIGAKEVIIFQPFVLKEVLDLMKKDTQKQKLLVNFEKKYPSIIEVLSENGAYNLFETLACILELNNRTFEALSDKSLEFRGNGGLKVDTYFSNDSASENLSALSKATFDYTSFIGSIMSFKLAGTDEKYLAYSTFEALGDMTITTLNQLKAKFKIENFVMMGSVFENSVLYSRILSKFQLSKPYFSKGFALDD